MSQFPGVDIGTRRKLLAAQIASQRGELNSAYHNLGKPIHYAEYGLRSFGFLRQNPWVFSVVPAAVSITAALVNLVRGKSAKALERERIREDKKRPKTLAGHALKWGGHGFRLFKLYRKLKPFFLP